MSQLDSHFVLTFEASAAEPPLEDIFLTSGGQINAAACRGFTDFAVSGAETSERYRLVEHGCTKVAIRVPSDAVTVDDSDPSTVTLNNRMKLLVSNERLGAAIQGSGVGTFAGAGSDFLVSVMKRCKGHCTISLNYGNWPAFTSVVLISNVKLQKVEPRATDATLADGLPVTDIGSFYDHVADTGVEMNVRFQEDLVLDKILTAGAKIVEEWATTAWDLRTKLIYKYSPSLTKSVARVPVGVANEGFVLVHDILDQTFAFTNEGLNSLLEHALFMRFDRDEEDRDAFLDAAAEPSLQTTQQYAKDVCSALSVVANYMVAYRADGRTQIGATGSNFGATESWLRQPMRAPWEANDCDGSALLITTMLQTAKDMEAEERLKHPYINAVHNVMSEHYTWGVAVLGANAASADKATGGGRAQVAGHAIALMVPTMSLLKALDDGASHSVDGQRNVPLDQQKDLAEARFAACFHGSTDANLASWQEALRSDELSKLQAFGIEGTTPASAILYVHNDAQRAQAATRSQQDDAAQNKIKPHIARGLKMLHVGGTDAEHPHKFYHDFVEITTHPSHPLYKNEGVRKLGHAASTFVFSKPTGNKLLKEAGVPPKDLVLGNFVATPAYKVDTDTGLLLDDTSLFTKKDVMPPRRITVTQPVELSAFQSQQYKKSIAALKTLDGKLSKDGDGHCVQYLFSLATLVHAPSAVEHFATRVVGKEANAAAGVVDFDHVDGLAVTDDGEPVSFVSVNIVVGN